MKTKNGFSFSFTFLTYCILLVISLCWVTYLEASTKPSNGNFKTIFTYDKNNKYYPDSVWLISATPELMGWNSKKLHLARQYSESIGSAAVIIIENGVVVSCWGDVSFRYKCHSIRKSLLNALYGIHVDNSNININKTLGELEIDDIKPSLTTTEKKAKISDLLKSRSGVYHQSAYETKSMRDNRPARGSHYPGTFWYYNNWDFNTLLTIFEQETKQKIFDEFKNKIATPLQFEHFDLNDTAYYYEDNKSIHPAYLFRMSSVDMARFGLLYLRSGLWQDKRILSERWLQESTTNYSNFGTNKFVTGFGYLWWIGRDSFQASGNGGHRMVIIPQKNLIIVHRVDTEKAYYTKVNLKKFNKLFHLILAARDY